VRLSVKIERLSLLKPRYAVSGGAVWEGRAFREPLTAEDHGRRLEFRPDGRKRFVLLVDGRESASAARAGREWVVKGEHATYVLRRRSLWRSAMEVLSNGEPIGVVERAHAPRGAVSVELAAEVPATVQAFIGFVAITLWRRAAASSGGGSGAIVASGGH
jgi:hypothetical protein